MIGQFHNYDVMLSLAKKTNRLHLAKKKFLGCGVAVAFF